jgi:hypothetical protein
MKLELNLDNQTLLSLKREAERSGQSVKEVAEMIIKDIVYILGVTK